MNLKEYCRAQNLNQYDLAELIGVSSTHVCLIIQGKRSPSIQLASKIESVTNGAVTLSDLVNPQAPSRLKNRKKKTVEKIKT